MFWIACGSKITRDTAVGLWNASPGGIERNGVRATEFSRFSILSVFGAAFGNPAGIRIAEDDWAGQWAVGGEGEMGGAAAMVASLVLFQWRVVCESVLRSAQLAGRLLFFGGTRGSEGGGTASPDCAFYDGIVRHERRHPVIHKFEYHVRYAFVNLDRTPSWFAATAGHHMTAQQARSLAGTSGPVYILCLPSSVGYEQNPISVYYCYHEDPHGTVLSNTIAEVTNSPWGERVTFCFDSKGDTVAKALHVSPFMDMQGAWQIHAPAPGEKLFLSVEMEHPVFRNFFTATLQARRVNLGQHPERFLWLMPQRIALWIYWQGLLLFWKGVNFVPHPKYAGGNRYRTVAENRDAAIRGAQSSEEERNSELRAGAGCPRFKWQEAGSDPWL